MDDERCPLMIAVAAEVGFFNLGIFGRWRARLSIYLRHSTHGRARACVRTVVHTHLRPPRTAPLPVPRPDPGRGRGRSGDRPGTVSLARERQSA